MVFQILERLVKGLDSAVVGCSLIALAKFAWLSLSE